MLILCLGFKRFSELRVFSQVSLLNELFEKSEGEQSRIPWAQNSGSPCTKLIISLSVYISVFPFFEKKV